MEVSLENRELGGTELDEQIEGSYVRDVSELVAVLNHCGGEQEAATILVRVTQDMSTRGYSKIADLIHAQAA